MIRNEGLFFSGFIVWALNQPSTPSALLPAPILAKLLASQHRRNSQLGLAASRSWRGCVFALYGPWFNNSCLFQAGGNGTGHLAEMLSTWAGPGGVEGGKAPARLGNGMAAPLLGESFEEPVRNERARFCACLETECREKKRQQLLYIKYIYINIYLPQGARSR